MGIIRVEPVGKREFKVEVAEETTGGATGLSFRYQVTVDQSTLSALRIDPTDSASLAALVRESFGFLLAREPAGAILPRFDLSVISKYFPDYLDEVGGRLAP
jgi:hypothetical protein